MSLKTWKKEFYPKSAKSAKQSEAVEHSLQKWRGVLPANLKKHGLERDNNVLYEGYDEGYLSGIIMFFMKVMMKVILDDETCSLCVWYYNEDPSDECCCSCATCPLFKATGKPCIDGDSVYNDAVYGNKISKMVKALEKARKFAYDKRNSNPNHQ